MAFEYDFQRAMMLMGRMMEMRMNEMTGMSGMMKDEWHDGYE